MRVSLRKLFVLAAVVTVFSVRALAQGGCDTGGGGCTAAPEMDPAMMGAASAVLVAGVAAVRARFRGPKK